MTEETTLSAGITTDRCPVARSRRAVPEGSTLLRGVALLSLMALVGSSTPPAARAAGVPIEGKLLVSGWTDQGGGVSYLMDGASDAVVTPPAYLDMGDISPDTTRAAYTVRSVSGMEHADAGDVWVANTDSSDAVNLTGPAGIGGVNCAPRWSPDGRVIAFHHAAPAPGQRTCDAGFQIWLMSADGVNPHQWMPSPGYATWWPSWAPDGYRVRCYGWGVGYLTADVTGADATGLPGVTGGNADWSKDGLKVTYDRMVPDTVGGDPGTRRQLILADADGGNPRVIAEQFLRDSDIAAHIAKYSFLPTDYDWFSQIRGNAGPQQSRWSPLGDQVAFVAALPFDPDGPEFWYQREIWLYDLRAEQLVRLTNDVICENTLSWAGPNTTAASPTVQVNNTTVTFPQVSEEGWTSIIRREDLPPLPVSYLRVGNFYEIRTTAEVTGPATVAMTYADSDVADTAESHLAILRYDETPGQWTDVTVSRDPVLNEVRGESSELGLMGLALPLPDSHFLDVSSSAEDPYWALWEIEAAYAAGIVSGYPDGTYEPSASVTRAQMAAFLVRALGQEPTGPADPQSWKDAYGYDPADPATWAVDFTDVPASGWGDPEGPYWAWFHIQRLYEIGVTQGVTATEYGPTQEVLRDQMAVFLIRALGQECGDPCVDTTCWAYDPSQPSTWAHAFADILATGQDTCHGAHWAWFHIQALYQTGVTLGCGDGTNYCPGDSVRRDEMAAFLARAFLGM